ncbi:MAG: 4-(cytidine 5'-diphospho)-2-C-methyl-D-erythritol kinase, partial [Oscillospiraceae bacterium]
MNRIVLEAAAKLNLSLDIVGRREDGYHLLDMVMQSVSLFDRVTLEKSAGIFLTSNCSYLPTDRKNTAYR